MKVSLILSALISCVLFINIAGKSPILIVPGLMGTKLKANVSSRDCYTGRQYELYWFNPLKSLCLYKLKLRFINKRFYNEAFTHVQVYARASHFGRTNPVECLLSTHLTCVYEYLKAFIDYFVDRRRGYRRGRDIRAAPYDWRLSPYELEKRGYFQNVMAEIREMYKIQKEQITIVAHSYGGVVMQYFLAKASKEWKDTYIKAFVPLGSPFGGATKILEALVDGILPFEFWGDSIFNEIKKIGRGIIRTFATPYYLAPQSSVFKEFTRDYYKDLFKKTLKYDIGWEQYTATQDKYTSDHPGVRTYCMYGYGISGKKDQVKYSSVSWWPRGARRPSAVEHYGDGTVDKVSLEVCHKWSPPSNRRIFRGMNHMQIVSDQRVLNRIYNIAVRS